MYSFVFLGALQMWSIVYLESVYYIQGEVAFMEEVIPSMVSTQENGVHSNFSCKYLFSCTI